MFIFRALDPNILKCEKMIISTIIAKAGVGVPLMFDQQPVIGISQEIIR